MRYILLLSSLMIFAPLKGQQLQSFSKIKLSDGSVLKVTIIEDIPGKYLKISIPNVPETIISYDEIQSVRHKNYVYNSKFVLAKGFYIDGSFGLLFGQSGEYDANRAGISLSVGANYRFNSYLSLGIGVEPTALHINSNYWLVPFYLHFSGNMIERKTSAFYVLDLGYSTANSGEIDGELMAMKGGWFLRPGLGIRFNKVALGVSYQVQKIHSEVNTDFWWGSQQTIQEDRTMRNVRVSTTFIF